MLLKKFAVKNYKNFKEEFVLDLGDVRDYKFNKDSIKNNVVKTGIIYGKNSVGKTNFGYAMFDIVYHLTDKMRPPEIIQFYTNADSDKQEAEFVYTFIEDGQEIVDSYTKTTAYDLIEESLYIDDKLIFSYNFATKKGNLKELKEIPGLQELNWNFKDKGMSFIRFIVNNSSIANDHPIMKLYRFVNKMLWFKGIDGLNNFIGYRATSENIFDYVLRNDLLDDLNKFLLNNGVAESLVCQTTPDNRKLVYFNHKMLLPYDLASSGTKVLVLFYYWYKQIATASFVFTDEFDAFYHFELAEKILRLAMQQDVQMLLTSHNTNLLSNKVMRPDCYFILTKNRITSFANATKRELREGHNLEKLFISGEFDEQ